MSMYYGTAVIQNDKKQQAHYFFLQEIRNEYKLLKI